MSEPKGVVPQKGIFSGILADESVSSTLSFGLIVVLVLAFKSSVLDANNIPSGSMIPTLKIGDFLFVNKMRYSLRMPFTEKELIRYDDPQRGDIVTFIPPQEALIRGEGDSREGWFPKRFVKRVIGLPGDTIRITPKHVETKRGPVTYALIEYKEKGSEEFKGYGPVETEPGNLLYDLDNVKAPSRSLFKEKKQDFEHYVLEGSDEYLSFYSSDFCGLHQGCEIPEGQYMVVGDNRDDSHDSRAWGFVPREDILGKAAVIYFSVNWKDYVCQFKSGKELSEKGDLRAERYEGEELEKHCGSPGDSWLMKTLRYRLFRMEVRWNRIGTILK
ncbi:signal peptidase I [Leptospira perolatii]|uniref:Signal peptidase I n=1 Tax=Leptospira perolatii TaxID=2023191 RepID=A0A2M9ZNH8_9LEPT|nr:signal peptidase I [Leptospira perolatii]PJZ68705.1 signal peptidase I [Leptospira perolatii]PJZ73541.1 signal peptidase I [Leptospira perolatii]